MSLRIKKPLGVRSDESKREENKKFIFAFEGEKTEKQYFNAIENNRTYLGINSLISIEALERTDPTRSNQLSVVKDVHTYLRRVLDFQSSHEDIKKHLKLLLQNYSDIIGDKSDEVIALINSIFIGNDYKENFSLFICKLNDLLIDAPSSEEFIEHIKNFSNDLDYEKDFDTVCIIIDRDRHSFTEAQYDSVLDICLSNNYELGITNPCFEFWLLLHITNAKEYLSSDILDNKRPSKNGKTFLETCLTNKLGSYKKNKLKFDNFKDNISIAIENNNLYCNDINKLKFEVGSSVGLIISKLLNS